MAASLRSSSITIIMRLRLAYWGVLLICVVPIIPGVLGIVSSALSYIPAVGLNSAGVEAFQQVWQWTGIER
ncbi:hypothetical protein ACT691_02520, partial [Vibrio metschnikovii]